MLRKTITYTNFNDLEVVEDFYFNLSQAELLQLETSEKGGYGEMLKNIAAAENAHIVLDTFKKIILLAYGEKSDDGKLFVKNDEVRASFENHAAFPVLYMELATDSESASEFASGIMPAGLTAEAAIAGQLPKPQDHLQKKVVEKELPTVTQAELDEKAQFLAWKRDMDAQTAQAQDPDLPVHPNE